MRSKALDLVSALCERRVNREKAKPKRSGPAFEWAVLSHFNGVRFYQKRATAECDAKEKLNGGAAPPGQQSMRGERGVQEERNGFGLGCSFTLHWHALSARARYRRMWKSNGSALPPGAQSMCGEREAKRCGVSKLNRR